MKKSIFYLMLTLLSVLGAYVVVEITLHVSPKLYKRSYYYIYEPAMFARAQNHHHLLKPNVNDVHIRRGEFSVYVRTNSQGLREDREIAIPKPKNTFRVAVLGDSFAFGYGVDRELAFHSVIEENLQRKYPDIKIEIINMGFASGYSPDAAYIYLKEEAIKYQPDLVLHIFCYSNDLGNILQNLPYSTFDESGLPVKVDFLPRVVTQEGWRIPRVSWEFEEADAYVAEKRLARLEDKQLKAGVLSVERFKEARLISIFKRWREIENQKKHGGGLLDIERLMLPSEPQKLFELYNNLTLNPHEPEDEFVTASWKKGWEHAVKFFNGMNDFAKSKNIPFGIVFVPPNFLVDYHPSEGEKSRYAKLYDVKHLDEAYKMNKPVKIFGKEFDRHGIAYLDPTRGMQENKSEDFYFLFDAHWNNAGNRRYGELLADWIITKNWVGVRQ